MATSFKSQQGNGEYSLQFETDNEEKYKLVEKAAEMAVDGKTAADVTKVKHGRWRKSGNEKKCSLCKFIYYNNNDDFNYCPNCGAKMDLKKGLQVWEMPNGLQTEVSDKIVTHWMPLPSPPMEVEE